MNVSSGSSHPTLHSMWLSRNVSTGLVASLAPRTRERMRPKVSAGTPIRTLALIIAEQPDFRKAEHNLGLFGLTMSEVNEVGHTITAEIVNEDDFVQ
jgi:hypothetical protein